VVCASELVKALQLPGLRSALTRLERASMETTTLQSFRELVMETVPGLWERGWSESKSVLTFPRTQCDVCSRVHQSEIHVFGWKDPGRQLSAEFGSIAVDQAEQLDLSHYTIAKTRLRQNNLCVNKRAEKLGLNPRQMSLACNPEDSEHWIARTFDPDAGMRIVNDEKGRPLCDVILSSFNDNAQHLPEGYHDDLETLKGSVFYDRLVLGKWARAEGLVFPMYDPKIVVPAPAGWAEWGGYPPADWPRWRGIDFGYRNPFVCLWLATAPDGTDWLYREWSRSEMLVEDHARKICQVEHEELEALRHCRALSDNPAQAFAMKPYLEGLNVRGSFADHDAEDAATLARHGVRTVPARKDIDNGIKAVIASLNLDKFRIVQGSLVAENALEVSLKLPTSLPKELSRYTYQKLVERSRNPNDAAKEKPVDAMNHRIDALRYVLYSRSVTPRPSVWVAA
jgi:phage terminase large subunit